MSNDQDDSYLMDPSLLPYGLQLQMGLGVNLNDPLGVSLYPEQAELAYTATNPYGAPPGYGTSSKPSSNRTQFAGVVNELVDPAYRAIFAGPDAFAPTAFTPQAVMAPDDEQLLYQQYRQYMDGQGLEQIALRGAQAGMLPSQLQSYVMELASVPPDETNPDVLDDVARRFGVGYDQVATDFEQIQTALPSYVGDALSVGGRSRVGVPEGNQLDSNLVQKIVNDAYLVALQSAPLLAAQAAGDYVDQAGVLYAMEPTAQMEKFDDLGLAYPTEQYGEGRYGVPAQERDLAVQTAGDYQAQLDELQRRLEDSMAARTPTRQPTAAEMARDTTPALDRAIEATSSQVPALAQWRAMGGGAYDGERDYSDARESLRERGVSTEPNFFDRVGRVVRQGADINRSTALRSLYGDDAPTAYTERIASSGPNRDFWKRQRSSIVDRMREENDRSRQWWQQNAQRVGALNLARARGQTPLGDQARAGMVPLALAGAIPQAPRGGGSLPSIEQLLGPDSWEARAARRRLGG